MTTFAYLLVLAGVVLAVVAVYQRIKRRRLGIPDPPPPSGFGGFLLLLAAGLMLGVGAQ